jgi:nitroreductase
MELKEAINKRHSIREYETKKIPKNILKELILNASKAPSASNRQPWKFYCISSYKKREIIAGYLKEMLKILKKDVNSKPKNLQKIIRNFYSNMGNCPHIIFIFREAKNKEESHIFPNDIASISCAVENLMLSAVEKGLGTCWIGSFKELKTEKKIKKLLNTPKNYELIASIIVGYPKKGYKPLIREKKKLSEILKFI